MIESGFPIPPAKRGVGRGSTSWPWSDMKVGDSFKVPRDKARSVKVAAVQYAKRHGVAFTSRMIDDELRIWRTK